MIEVDESNFYDEVLSSDKPVLVDFYATWCKPCKKVTPVLESMEEEFSDRMKIVKIDIDKSDIASEHGIQSVPTLYLYKGGEPVKIIVGAQPRGALVKALTEFI